MNRATLCCEVNSYTGYGQHAFQVVQALQAKGHYVSIRPLSVSEPAGAPVPAGLKKLFVGSAQPEPWEIAVAPLSYSPSPVKHTAWFTMHETTKLSAEAVIKLNRAKLVLTPSQWGASVMSACGVKSAIRVVNLGVDPAVFRYRKPPQTTPFTFGVAGRLLNGPKRKGVADAVQAFLDAFPKDQSVRLKVKLFPDCPQVDIPHDPRIEVTRAYFTDAQVADWLVGCHAFLSHARGEGFGLLQLQAMALGRPVIGCAFGGLSEFMHSTNSLAVPFKLVPAVETYTGQGLWAEPERDAMVALMQHASRYPEHCEQVGRAAAESVKHMTWEQHNRALFGALAEFGIVEPNLDPRWTVNIPSRIEVTAQAADDSVAVIMATHNRAGHVRRALESLNRSLAGRRWGLFVADDSTDNTLEIVRNYPTSAEQVIATGFTPTKSIGEAKNRACRMALPYLNRYDWVAYQDDDDECLPAKFDWLLPYAKQQGHEFIIGDVLVMQENGSHTVSKAIHAFAADYGGYCPGMVIHRSHLLKSGIFNERLYCDDDVYGFMRLEQQGVITGCRSGNPVYRHALCADSSGNTNPRYRGQVPTFDMYRRLNEPASFCTAAIGARAAREAVVMLKTLRLFHPRTPVVVLCDVAGQEIIGAHPELAVAFFPVCTNSRIQITAEHIAKGNGFAGARANALWLLKIDALNAALVKYPETIFLDTDMLITGLIEKPSAPCHFGLSPNHMLTSKVKDQHLHYGVFSSGIVYCSNIDAAAWWRNTLIKSMESPLWGKAPAYGLPHGMFGDQSCLDLVHETQWQCHYYHPGYNIWHGRFCQGEHVDSEIIDAGEFIDFHGFQVGYGMFLNGFPVRCFHIHFAQDQRLGKTTVLLEAIIRMLRQSRHPAHSVIADLAEASHREAIKT